MTNKERRTKIENRLQELEEENSDNLCDSFENVRATLSKFNKE